MPTYCLTYNTHKRRVLEKNEKSFTKKGRRMGFEDSRIVENRKERQKGRVIENGRKRGITSTEFPEGGNTIYTNRTPGIPTGEQL